MCNFQHFGTTKTFPGIKRPTDFHVRSQLENTTKIKQNFKKHIFRRYNWIITTCNDLFTLLWALLKSEALFLSSSVLFLLTFSYNGRKTKTIEMLKWENIKISLFSTMEMKKIPKVLTLQLNYLAKNYFSSFLNVFHLHIFVFLANF